MTIRLTIMGEPVSSKNSRELVTLPRWSEKTQKKVPMAASIKSKKALSYEQAALLQIPAEARQQLIGPVRLTAKLYYASERPDLDASLIRDILQDRYVGRGENRVLIQRGVYRNDRQVREEHYFHDIDRVNPRAEIEVEALQAQQATMFHVEQAQREPVMSVVTLEPRADGKPF